MDWLHRFYDHPEWWKSIWFILIGAITHAAWNPIASFLSHLQGNPFLTEEMLHHRTVIRRLVVWLVIGLGLSLILGSLVETFR